MLDSEHPQATAASAEEPAQPPRRRRSASRPAGPPAPVEAPPASAPVVEAASVQVVAEPVALAPTASVPAEAEPVAEASEPVKRARRSRAKKAPDADAPALPLVTEAAPAAPVEAAVGAEAPAKPARRRAVTKKTKPVVQPVAELPTEASVAVEEVVEEEPVEAEQEAAAEVPAEPEDAVAASLAGLSRGRRRTRRPALAETFGLGEEATPGEVLDTLAAAIGGLLEPSGVSDDDDETDEESAEDGDEDTEAVEGEGEEGQPRRRRRRRGGRRRRRGVGDSAEGEDTSDEEPTDAEPVEGEETSEPESDEATTEGTSRRRRRRRRRGEDSGEPEDDSIDVVVRVREPRRRTSTANDEVTGIEGSTRMEAKKQRRREGRAAGRRRTPILSESEFLARREAVDRKMLIRQADDYSQIAVIEDGVLVEHYVDRASATSMIGNIYLARVQNVLPSMEAAFVDIGRGRNAVLYAGEIDWESFGVTGQDKKVERVFKSGQQVLVQVTKDPVGAKGARLTSHISIPGRYIVYSPGGHLSGISRKLPETERKRLKGILDELIDAEASVIVRTAAEGASEEELVRDVNRLKAQWEVLEKKVKAGQAPQQLYAEPDLTVRIVRDLFTEDFGSLVIDGNTQADDAYDTVDAYVRHVAPHLAERMERWDRADKGDIFDAFRVHEQVAKALERKVFLPSGGSLIIDRTEAMTVIDVNTGKFTGTSGNLEATVTSNNLEAAEEIVRQLRLRDIGGIIVIDFIDMVLPANRELLLRRLVECLGRDRTRHQVAEVTSLGLVQMTRKKIGTGLAEAFTVACETCKGRGYHVHDAPVASQAPADGGDRDSSRRSPRGGAATSTRRSSRSSQPSRPKPTEPAHAPEPASEHTALLARPVPPVPVTQHEAPVVDVAPEPTAPAPVVDVAPEPTAPAEG
ncbi:MAG TPA: Rne/Rng family ribonuclease [Propionicimonas sp.]|nr:Rne/Rng family ribonuclease [Propionicimonas sp.]